MRHPFCSEFGKPAAARFYFEEDNGGNASTGVAEQSTAASDSALVDFDEAPAGNANGERVEGEKPPDFGSLGKKSGKTTPSGDTDGVKSPEKTQKAAPANPEAKEKAPKVEPKAPEKAAKAPEPAKAAEKPPEKVADKEEKAQDKPPEIPATDDDIDALKPKPGAPTQVIKSFDDMRARMKAERTTARAALAEAIAAKAEAAKLKESTGKLPEEVEKELEGLRKLSLLVQAENSPVFKSEFDAKIKAADEGVYTLLAKHGLKGQIIEDIKAAAAKAGGDIEAWPRLQELVAAFKNPVDQQEFLGALKARRDVIGARSARLTELGASKEKFMQAFSEREQQSQKEFGTRVAQVSEELAAKNDWILERLIPEGATKEQRETIEAENAEVKKRAESFADNVRDMYHRNPDKAAEIAIKAVEADYLRGQVDSLTKERDKSAARVKELETRLSKIQTAGRMAHVEAPSDNGKKVSVTTEEEGKVGGDGASALSRFLANKRGS